MPDLTFNEERHEYKLDGVTLPSVTQVLKEMGWTGYYPPGPYRVRGHQVHKATIFVDNGTIDNYDLGGEIIGYVQSYRILMREFDFEWESTETPAYDPRLMIAGTPDRVGRRRNNGRRVVLDLKTGETGDETRLQLAAYTIMKFEEDLAGVERYRAVLNAEGKAPKLSMWTGRKYAIDFTGWQGVAGMWHWLKATGGSMPGGR